MKLTDIIPLEKWMELEDQLQEFSGLDVSVFNTDGRRIADNRKWVNDLCPIIKANDKGQTFICAVANSNLSAIAEKTKEPVIDECDAGLLKVVVPIFREDQFLGVISGCGGLGEDGEVDAFLTSKTTDIPEEELEEKLDSVKQISADRVEETVAKMTDALQKLLGKTTEPN